MAQKYFGAKKQKSSTHKQKSRLVHAIALHDQGQLDAAESIYLGILKKAPRHYEATHLCGVIALQRGQTNRGIDLIRKALVIDSGQPGAHLHLGHGFRDLGLFEEALRSYDNALKLAPGSVLALNGRGNMLMKLRSYQEAFECYDRALELAPNDVVTLHNRGVTLNKLGRSFESEPFLRKALALNPRNHQISIALGESLLDQGRHQEAIECFKKALLIRPELLEPLFCLGKAYKAQGKLSKAKQVCQQALLINPNFFHALYLLAGVLKDMGNLAEAEAVCLKVLAIKPDFPAIHNLLACILQDSGRLAEAENAYRRAVELDPQSTLLHSNLLFLLNRTGNRSAEECLMQARLYGEKAASKVCERFTNWRCTEMPARLRIGFVSGDLGDHPVGFFLESIFANLDQQEIELIAYSSRDIQDEVTARLRPHFTQWRSLLGMSDGDAAALIHADGIHVLIDLSGHTGRNRLPIFAWKPAPVQCTWLGYFATTGLAEMDYILADAVGIPQEHHAHFTEKVWYLPQTRLCFTPPAGDLPVTQLPALTNDHVTFGSFQILEKIGEGVLEHWARIMVDVPNSRLRLQSNGLGDPKVVDDFLLRLKQQHIDLNRVSLHDRSLLKEDYLASIAQVDIILDSFPTPGATTTCEALWMGVPTVTIAGDNLNARQAAALLSAAGLGDWVADSREDYVALAVSKAQDMVRLATLRAALRDQVLVSPVFDAPRFAANFADALWGMWREVKGDSNG